MGRMIKENYVGYYIKLKSSEDEFNDLIDSNDEIYELFKLPYQGLEYSNIKLLSISEFIKDYESEYEITIDELVELKYKFKEKVKEYLRPFLLNYELCFGVVSYYDEIA